MKSNECNHNPQLLHLRPSHQEPAHSVERFISFQIFKEHALLGERRRTKEVNFNIFRTASLNGGSGWSRTIDPRLIKTVL